MKIIPEKTVIFAYLQNIFVTCLQSIINKSKLTTARRLSVYKAAKIKKLDTEIIRREEEIIQHQQDILTTGHGKLTHIFYAILLIDNLNNSNVQVNVETYEKTILIKGSHQ